MFCLPTLLGGCPSSRPSVPLSPTQLGRRLPARPEVLEKLVATVQDTIVPALMALLQKETVPNCDVASRTLEGALDVRYLDTSSRRLLSCVFGPCCHNDTAAVVIVAADHRAVGHPLTLWRLWCVR